MCTPSLQLMLVSTNAVTYPKLWYIPTSAAEKNISQSTVITKMKSTISILKRESGGLRREQEM